MTDKQMCFSRGESVLHVTTSAKHIHNDVKCQGHNESQVFT